MTRTLQFSLLILLVLAATQAASQAAETTRPNILFIAVDDLRPELQCYGQQHIHSPNIDRLARSGVLFEQAYCMVPTCGASRASLLSGIRPSRHRFVTYQAWAEKEAPGIATFNTHFRKNGYYTLSLGKIFHHTKDSAAGWSEPVWRPPRDRWYQLPQNQQLHEKNQKSNVRLRGPAWEAADVEDDAYWDGLLAKQAIKELGRLKQQTQPFFLAVGFFKPHLPFVAPQKYWDLYDHDKIQPPTNYHVPQDAPPESIHSSSELRAYAGIPAKGPVSDETARNLIHGYYACVSYTDAQIGKLLDELDRLELTKNTIVVLWGDHGWNLGEHTLWCKHSCYETSMHIPLIVRAPGVAGGQRTAGLTESVDLYPSLCELAGLELPSHLQGRSFVPLLSDPKQAWKSAAVGRFGGGDTIRTAGHRYTEYRNRTGKQTATMLYDHQRDPGENTNISKQANQGQTAAKLSKALHQQMGRDGALGAKK